ncbi:hypothetical protein [Bosea sp. TAF32]|uniref:hypothetical protein n=1 Tax=Bosea sp. TAF32 TaxID=3237482 RepID=UPI003F92E66F
MLRRTGFRPNATGGYDDTALRKSLFGKTRKIADLNVTRWPCQGQALRVGSDRSDEQETGGNARDAAAL